MMRNPGSTDAAFEPNVLESAHGAVAACCYGAHVTRWRTAEGWERLFVSRNAELRAGAAIRGGVPVIFPQFAGLGPLSKHGFARTALWRAGRGEANQLSFSCSDTAATRALWPHAFTAQYLVTLEPDALVMELFVQNCDSHPFSFTAALHTYLRVADIAEVALSGLQGLRYRDSAAGDVMAEESSERLHINGEVDRIYFDCRQPVTVHETGQRDVRCSAEGFPDVVIWNPGPVKSTALSDMEPDGYRHMVCVEAAVIARPVMLQPGERWSGIQRLQVLP